MPYCLACGSMIDEYDSGYYARNMFCIPCYNRKASEVPMISCARCSVRIKQAESTERQGNRYCNYCFSELERQSKIPKCAMCGSKLEDWEKSVRTPDGKKIHYSCWDKYVRTALREVSGPLPRNDRRSGSILRSLVGRIGAMLA